MNVSRWLDDLKKLIEEIEDKKYEIEKWGSTAQGTGGRTDGERVQSTSTGDALVNAVFEMIFTEDVLSIRSIRLP